MASDRWAEIERLFFAALPLSAEERIAFLASACPNDPDLRQDVEALLAGESDSVVDPSVFSSPEAPPIANGSLVGRRLGMLTIRAFLGAGTIGDVYRAYDATIGRDVAVKVLPPALTSNAGRLARLERDARILASLNHPNVETIHRIEYSDGIHAVIGELVEGETLANRIARIRDGGRRGSDPVRSLHADVDVVAQAARALAAAHAADVLHRDIKPQHIMVRDDGFVKVVDFGLAQTVTSTPLWTTGGTSWSATRTAVLSGTLRYISPEQANAQPLTAASDIFSLGLVLYELIARRHPFGVKSTRAYALALAQETPLPPSRTTPEVPRTLDELTLRMLARDPARRPTAPEVVEALQTLKTPSWTPVVTPGARVGVYEIVGLLGKGGMGEVYRARDPRLHRDVAIKVLPSETTDADRMARFEQEARAAAALNHPNILAVYDVGRHEGVPYIVSELLEGETLRTRVSGGQLSVRKVVEYATRVAEGLAAAHDKGIIHRDLKPENIFITADDRVKILDFGLAKLKHGPQWALPTTQAGVVLGTISYMSPEQLRGLAADHRSDIFSFGVVLFELLSGRRPFQRDTPIDTMNAIREDDPPDLPVERRVPPALARIVSRCLEKNPAARFKSADDLGFALDALSIPSGASAVIAPPARFTRARALRLVGAVAALIAVAGIGLWFGGSQAPPARDTVRFQIPAPGVVPAKTFTLSPDGRHLAFIAENGGADQLFVRQMDSLEARPLAGTSDATYPFWSPDGTQIGFFAQGKLKKIAAAGGPVQTLCDAASGRGATWNANGDILFSAGPTSAILRVAAAGGTPVPVTKLLDRASGHRFPAFLPDGVHFLYNVGADKPEMAGVYLASLDGATTVRLLPGETNALYVPADDGSSGYLLYRRDSTLMAQPFDSKTLQFAGELIPIAEYVPTSQNDGFGAFSASGTGTLAYRTRGPAPDQQLIWVERAGKRVGAAVGASGQTSALSPDQRTVAITKGTQGQVDIWLQDVRRDVITRFTFRAGISRNPVWIAEGNRVAFAFQAAGAYSSDIFIKPAAGGAEELLLRGGVNAYPMDSSADGRWLLFQQQDEKTGLDLLLLPLDGDRKPTPYLQTPFNEGNGRFAPGSPSPKWVAYESDESGQKQIYVQSIPAGVKYQISTAGGIHPRWRGDGKELFYLSMDRKLMAVQLALGATVESGTPRELFPSAGVTEYNVAADGQRFLLNVNAEEQGAAAPVTVVLGWTAGLKK
jgi:serine/threonine protein kinase/Tol biopolymer transport system component